MFLRNRRNLWFSVVRCCPNGALRLTRASLATNVAPFGPRQKKQPQISQITQIVLTKNVIFGIQKKATWKCQLLRNLRFTVVRNEWHRVLDLLTVVAKLWATAH